MGYECDANQRYVVDVDVGGGDSGTSTDGERKRC